MTSPMPAPTPDGSSASPVLVEYTGAVATVTLNRPAAYNAFNGALKDALLPALQDIGGNPMIRCVVLTGAGKAFCAGQDLKEHNTLMTADPAAAAGTVADFYNPLILAVTQMAKPVIAAINGVAAGAGAGLAFACDLRIAGESAALRTSFAQAGLSADSGLSFTLPRLVGLGRASRMLLLDEGLDASTALQWGAVDAVVPDAELPAAAAELAARLAAGPTTALSWLKQSLAVGAGGTLEQALAFENRAQIACFSSEDHAAALTAFADKKPPVFTGR